MKDNARLLAVAVLFSGAVIVAACSGGAESVPTDVPPTAVPTRPPPTVAPTVAPTSVGGLLTIAAAGPAVQVLSGVTDGAVFVAGVPATVKIIAADSNGVGSVEITVDGQVWNTVEADGEPIYEAILEWVPEVEGTHQVGIVVYDSDGVPSQLAAYAVTVLPAGTAAPAAPTEAATDTIPPAVSISAASDEINVGDDFDIYTNAVDEGGVVKLELWIGGVVRATWTFDGPPEDVSQSVFETLIWRNASEGEYEGYVKAWDSAGNIGESPRIDLTAAVLTTPTPLALP